MINIKDTNKIFEFTKINISKAKEIINNYPEGRQRSAILALLELAQRQNEGWLSVSAIEYVANLINIPYIRAYEVVTFYTMFNLKPVGKYHIQVCGTTPCWLRGAEKIMNKCQTTLNIKNGQTTSDNMFTLSEVECLGACVNAPVVQINDDYYEDLNEDLMSDLLTNLQLRKKVKVGSQIARQGSSPIEKLN